MPCKQYILFLLQLFHSKADGHPFRLTFHSVNLHPVKKNIFEWWTKLKRLRIALVDFNASCGRKTECWPLLRSVRIARTEKMATSAIGPLKHWTYTHLVAPRGREHFFFALTAEFEPNGLTMTKPNAMIECVAACVPLENAEIISIDIRLQPWPMQYIPTYCRRMRGRNGYTFYNIYSWRARLKHSIEAKISRSIA